MEAFMGAFSGVWIALAAIIFIGCGAFTATFGSMFWSLVVLITGSVVFEVLLGLSVWALIAANPLMGIAIVAIYIGIGAAYTGLWRWPAYLRKYSEHVKAAFNQWCDQHKKQLGDKTKEQAFEDFLDSSAYRIWHPSNNKERLSTWVLMWPFAMGWELSHKPLIWVFDTVYATLGEMFVAIGKQTARKNIKLD